MSKIPELKDRLIKIIYDEWFKIIVGGVLIAVISFYLPYILDGKDDILGDHDVVSIKPILEVDGKDDILGDHDVVSIKPIPESGLLLGETYMIKPNTNYSIDAANFHSGTFISYNWKDVSHTTRTSETNQKITLSKLVISAKLVINSGNSFIGEVSQGRPFNAGFCNLGGLTMHLIDEPVRSSDAFKIKLEKKSC